MMVTLASYESSQHCEVVVTCMFTMGIARHFTKSLNCDGPGFLQTSSFSTGFVNDKYTSGVSSASVVWLQFELV